MKFYSVYKKVLHRLQQKETPENEIILTDGLNAGISILSKVYQLSKTSVLSMELNKPVKLPKDFIELIFLEKDGVFQSANDYVIKADFIMISDRELVGDITLHYAGVPDVLTIYNQEDIPVPDMFIDAIVSYACYYYTSADAAVSTAYYNEFATATGIMDKEKQPKQTQAKK